SCVGKTMPVLIERLGRMPGQVGGRSPFLQAVHLDGAPDLIGSIHQVEIVGTSTNSLVGRLKARVAA
ncbi:MAG: TRAM domain-containing protein, partial [Candidatus Devosia euplotis]|nr:TRAM domain-containing protein [Candidatus Devosia euplotis]